MGRQGRDIIVGFFLLEEGAQQGLARHPAVSEGADMLPGQSQTVQALPRGLVLIIHLRSNVEQQLRLNAIVGDGRRW